MSAFNILASNAVSQTNIVDLLFEGMKEQMENACRMLWAHVSQFLLDHWLPILLFLVGGMAFAFAQYLWTGRWGPLASLMYRFLYIGGVLLVVLVYGPEVFANSFIEFILLVLGTICYAIVGILIDVMGIRSRRDPFRN